MCISVNVYSHIHICLTKGRRVAAMCCSVLQCVAVCCSVLQCVAVCCSVLQCVHNVQIYAIHIYMQRLVYAYLDDIFIYNIFMYNQSCIYRQDIHLYIDDMSLNRSKRVVLNV